MAACVAYIWLLLKYAFICIPNTRRHIRILNKHWILVKQYESLIRSPLRRCVLNTTLCDKVCQCLATGFSWYSGFLHQLNWLSRYNWNIVESGVKHHKPHQLIRLYNLLLNCVYCIYEIEKHSSLRVGFG